MIKYILCALLGYFAGCFSPSYLLSRRRGFDIRTFGSGNAGATNMMLADPFNAVDAVWNLWQGFSCYKHIVVVRVLNRFRKGF